MRAKVWTDKNLFAYPAIVFEGRTYANMDVGHQGHGQAIDDADATLRKIGPLKDKKRALRRAGYKVVHALSD